VNRTWRWRIFFAYSYGLGLLVAAFVTFTEIPPRPPRDAFAKIKATAIGHADNHSLSLET
jgi:hypothetical protein